MESSRICSFTGCNNTSFHQNCSFYEFPEDFNLCIQWIEMISSREYFEEFAFRGPEAFRERYICSDHFTEEDFVDINNISSGLKKDAVPFYFISNKRTDDPANVMVKIENQEEFWDNLSNSSMFSVDILSDVKVEDASSHFLESGDSALSCFSNLNKKIRGSRGATIRKSNESAEKRRLKCAERAYLRRQMETPEEKEKRRRANAERQAKKRMMETPEQREIRRVKDLLRARQRRQKETEEEAKLRKMYDAARAQARRQNESEEEKNFRRMKDLQRVTKRRRNETEEERLERLRKNREYSAKRRCIQRLEQEFSHSKDLAGNNFLTLKNFDQDSIGLNGNYLQSLNTSFDAEFLNEENTSSNGMAYSHFSSCSSQDSSSFDGNSEESLRSFSNDYDNPVENLLPNRENKEEINEIPTKI